jgi:hypothetical protein
MSYRIATLAAATLAGLAATAVVAAAGDSIEPRAVTVYGRAVAVGDGAARTYLTLEDGRPTELGVALSEAALRGLQPNDHALPGSTAMPDGHAMFEHVLQLPAGNPTPFRHVVLNWNPGGHEPPGIYDVPHFDFHFYTIDDAERRAIVPGPDFDAKAARHPSADELPAGYVAAVPVPMMGMHWLDPKTPELSGRPFTQTFIAGTWDGRTTFLEPMITKAFLEAKPDFSAPIPEVKRHAVAGWYPTAYAIRWDAASREYRVALRGFARTGDGRGGI